MKRWRQTTLLTAVVIGSVHFGGCTQHRVDVQPIRVEPIHLTIDVNVRVDRELDRFFDYEREVVPSQTETVLPPVEPVPTLEVPPGL